MDDDTPPTPPPAPPAPPRRKAAAGTRKSTRATPPTTQASGNDGAAENGTEMAKAAGKPRAKRSDAGKPRPRKAAAARSGGVTGRTKAAATKVGSVVEDAAGAVTTKAGKTARKVTKRTSSAADAVARSAPVKSVSDTRERMGNRNFFAAVVGGVAALGAAAGGILYAVKSGKPSRGTAHQADGTDSSASFNAGIADEGTIPE